MATIGPVKLAVKVKGDAAAGAGGDGTLEFITPLFNKAVKPGTTDTVARRHKESFPALDLDEDVGSIPNPDEIRARSNAVSGVESRRDATGSYEMTH